AAPGEEFRGPESVAEKVFEERRRAAFVSRGWRWSAVSGARVRALAAESDPGARLGAACARPRPVAPPRAPAVRAQPAARRGPGTAGGRDGSSARHLRGDLRASTGRRAPDRKTGCDCHDGRPGPAV